METHQLFADLVQPAITRWNGVKCLEFTMVKTLMNNNWSTDKFSPAERGLYQIQIVSTKRLKDFSNSAREERQSAVNV